MLPILGRCTQINGVHPSVPTLHGSPAGSSQDGLQEFSEAGWTLEQSYLLCNLKQDPPSPPAAAPSRAQENKLVEGLSFSLR